MLYAMRNPAECGLKVDGVSVRDMSGYMQRTMRLLEKGGSPTATDNIRVIESAQEITYRPVVNNVESEEERVFALRMDPLRLEMFCRHSKDEMRLIGKPPAPFAFPSSTRRWLRPSACDMRQREVENSFKVLSLVDLGSLPRAPSFCLTQARLTGQTIYGKRA